VNPMIELTCWGCGWEGRVRDHFSGRRVICKRCRAVNLVPDAVTKEVYLGDRFNLSDTPTAEIPAYTGPPDVF
jgi:hypothetical protein